MVRGTFAQHPMIKSRVQPAKVETRVQTNPSFFFLYILENFPKSSNSSCEFWRDTCDKFHTRPFARKFLYYKLMIKYLLLLIKNKKRLCLGNVPHVSLHGLTKKVRKNLGVQFIPIILRNFFENVILTEVAAIVDKGNRGQPRKVTFYINKLSHVIA